MKSTPVYVPRVPQHVFVAIPFRSTCSLRFDLPRCMRHEYTKEKAVTYIGPLPETDGTHAVHITGTVLDCRPHHVDRTRRVNVRRALFLSGALRPPSQSRLGTHDQWTPGLVDSGDAGAGRLSRVVDLHHLMTSLRTLLGVVFFLGGAAINISADVLVQQQRDASSDRYIVPVGGLFRWISCPNYLGEILEWIGWAIATGSLAGLSFAIWTVANLAPRAYAHHRWYQQKFPNYPGARKALVPYIW